jgi:hypothetical protein
MHITTTTTEIECSADELRQSNSLSDAFVQVMRKCFNGPAFTPTYNESEDDDEDNCD